MSIVLNLEQVSGTIRGLEKSLNLSNCEVVHEGKFRLKQEDRDRGVNVNKTADNYILNKYTVPVSQADIEAAKAASGQSSQAAAGRATASQAGSQAGRQAAGQAGDQDDQPGGRAGRSAGDQDDDQVDGQAGSQAGSSDAIQPMAGGGRAGGQEQSFYILVVFFDRDYSRGGLLGCEYFNKYFDVDESLKKVVRPHVYIVTNVDVTGNKIATIPEGLVSVPYRFVCLTRIYPILYTPMSMKPSTRTLSANYERLETREQAFNDRDFPKVFDSDPMAIVVNAVPGELIRYTATTLDGFTPYSEVRIRRVTKTKSTIGSISDSGIDGLDFSS